ncbi:MAG: HEAT repeat domain-containing protein, partial [Acidimicrobiales bacterium]
MTGDALRAAAAAGHRRDADAARTFLTHDDPEVRSVALGALERMGQLSPADLETALGDPHPGVRRRACELAAGY